VIGGGFIGSQIAAALALVGAQPVMAFTEAGIGERTFGPDLSRFVTEAYRARRVEVVGGDSVAQIVPRADEARASSLSFPRRRLVPGSRVDVAAAARPPTLEGEDLGPGR
jgi:NADPH-dependent 2,4-dienoyl-CoA reductase/sulfur reductase-like enzyme